jgi:hypothetical protein
MGGLFAVFPDEPVTGILLCPFVENLLFSKEADPDSLWSCRNQPRLDMVILELTTH